MLNYKFAGRSPDEYKADQVAGYFADKFTGFFTNQFTGFFTGKLAERRPDNPDHIPVSLPPS